MRQTCSYTPKFQKKQLNTKMFPFFHFVKGAIINLFNPRISLLAFVSSSAKIDKSAFIYRGVKIKDAVIGPHTYISSGTDVENAEIGKFCSIADHCRIGMGTHNINYLSSSPLFTQSQNALQEKWVNEDSANDIEERVCIGNDVWIGSHVLIKGGVNIGDGAVIGAGAVVVKDVQPYSIVGGVPAALIKYRFDENTIKTLLSFQWWNKDDSWLKQNVALFNKVSFIDDLKNYI